MAAVLTGRTPQASQELSWAEGQFRCRIDAYPSPADLPLEYVTSVRCLVMVDDKIVVCTNVDGGSHPWPGGRREPGETDVQTACREVHEETGWLLDPDSLEPLGWLHLEHLNDRPPGHRYVDADFLMVVYAARAHDRDGGRDNPWSDTEGHEVSSQLLPIDDAIALIADDEHTALPFLEIMRDGGPTSRR